MSTMSRRRCITRRCHGVFFTCIHLFRFFQESIRVHDPCRKIGVASSPLKQGWLMEREWWTMPWRGEARAGDSGRKPAPHRILPPHRRSLRHPDGERVPVVRPPLSFHEPKDARGPVPEMGLDRTPWAGRLPGRPARPGCSMRGQYALSRSPSESFPRSRRRGMCLMTSPPAM